MAILGIWAAKEQKQLCGKNVENLLTSRKQYNSVFLPNFSQHMLVSWVRSCDSDPRRLSFHWTGPITRGPCASAGFRPRSQIDVCERSSALTVACVVWYSLEQPASFDLRATAALWCCCCHLYRQFATHNYFILLHLPVQLFFFLQVAVIICCLNKLKGQHFCLFVYVKRNLLTWGNETCTRAFFWITFFWL